jgi:hypothetical protein
MAVVLPIVSEFDGKGIKKAIAQFKQLETTGEKAQFAIKKAAVPAAAALGGLALAIGDATKAAMEDQQEQAKLALTLQNVTGASAKQTKAIEEQISAMSRASGIADTDYRKSLEALVRGTKDVDIAMRDMNLVMDISTALQMDSSTVADALAKAYQGNFKALRSLTPEMATMIKEGASLNEIMDVLGGTFGGAVSRNAETAAGKMAIFKNSIAETKESIGAAFLPVLEAVLPKMNAFAAWAQDNPQVFTRIALAIGSIAAATVALNVAMKTNPLVLAAAAVVGMAVGFNKLADAIGRVNSAAKFFIEKIMVAINPAVGLMANILRPFNSLLGIGNDSPVATPTTNLQQIEASQRAVSGAIPSMPAIPSLPAVAPAGGGGGGGGGTSRPAPISREMQRIANLETINAPLSTLNPGAQFGIQERMANVNINVTGGLATSAEIGESVVNALRAYSRSAGPLQLQVA